MAAPDNRSELEKFHSRSFCSSIFPLCTTAAIVLICYQVSDGWNHWWLLLFPVVPIIIVVFNVLTLSDECQNRPKKTVVTKEREIVSQMMVSAKSLTDKVMTVLKLPKEVQKLVMFESAILIFILVDIGLLHSIREFKGSSSGRRYREDLRGLMYNNSSKGILFHFLIGLQLLCDSDDAVKLFDERCEYYEKEGGLTMVTLKVYCDLVVFEANKGELRELVNYLPTILKYAYPAISLDLHTKIVVDRSSAVTVKDILCSMGVTQGTNNSDDGIEKVRRFADSLQDK